MTIPTGNASNAVLPTSLGTGNGLQPKRGPRTVPIMLAFSAATSVNVDMSVSQSLDAEEFIQTIYVDNSLGPRSVNITVPITGQILTWPAGTQGYLPVLSCATPKFTCASSGGVDVLAQFCTMMLPAQIWTSTMGGLGIDGSGSAPAVAANILATLAVNGKRAYVEAQNQSATLMQVVLDDGATGTPSIFLLSAATGDGIPGGSWSDTTFKGRVRIACASASKQCMLRET